jgi:hypothetical protein
LPSTREALQDMHTDMHKKRGGSGATERREREGGEGGDVCGRAGGRRVSKVKVSGRQRGRADLCASVAMCK